jgi:hypothetical protein
MLYSDYQVHVMGHVPYVGFATRSRATAMTRFTFFIKKKKKKKRVVTKQMMNDDNKPKLQGLVDLIPRIIEVRIVIP